MFRLWGKTFLHNRMTNDIVVCNDSEESRTSKIFQAVTEICQTFDLSEPIWLDINIRDFKRHSKTRFTQDNFMNHKNGIRQELFCIEWLFANPIFIKIPYVCSAAYSAASIIMPTFSTPLSRVTTKRPALASTIFLALSKLLSPAAAI